MPRKAKKDKHDKSLNTEIKKRVVKEKAKPAPLVETATEGYVHSRVHTDGDSVLDGLFYPAGLPTLNQIAESPHLYPVLALVSSLAVYLKVIAQ